MALLQKILKGICYFFLLISILSIFVLALLTVYDVLMRFLFGKPNSGLPEISQILLIVSMTGMGFAVADGRVTRVGIIIDRFPKKINISFEIVMGLVGFAFFALCGWRLIAQIESSIIRKEAYFVIGFPRWPCYGALGFAFLSQAVGSVHFTIDRLINFKEAKARGSIEDDPEVAMLLDMDEGIENNGLQSSEKDEVAE